jgi:hypothetical protein
MSQHDDLFRHTIAEVQRARPEAAMRKIQQHHAGVLSFVVEHAGDLTHRMTEHGAQGQYGRGYVHDKASKVLRTLAHPYGFAKEHEENIVANVPYSGMSEGRYRHILKMRLAAYARAHAKLPAYNAPQFVARQIAVLIGRQEWKKVQGWLKLLIRMVESDDWTRLAGSDDPKYAPKRNPDCTFSWGPWELGWQE